MQRIKESSTTSYSVLKSEASETQKVRLEVHRNDGPPAGSRRIGQLSRL